jgi:transcriptional regulator with XRE-family HTH domain
MKSPHSKQYKAIIARLIQERERLGISQAELAKSLETTQSSISKIERAERRLDVAEFIRLCEALGISAAKLVREFESSSGRGSS